MNVAFPALLIFLFILPGLFFTLAFYNTENKPLNYIPLTHKAAVSFFITVVLHTLWISSIVGFTNDKININKILILISGVQDKIYADVLLTITYTEIAATACYLLTIYAFAYLLGKSLRGLVKYTKLDKKIKFLRLDSPWYYLLTGYDWEAGTPDGVCIAATVELAGQVYIYVGYLDKFFLDENGNIDRLVLTSTWRRSITHDKTKFDNSFSKRFYPIDGNYFVLKYAEIKSLNVQFIKIEEEPEFANHPSTHHVNHIQMPHAMEMTE